MNLGFTSKEYQSKQVFSGYDIAAGNSVKNKLNRAKEWRNHSYWFIGDVHSNVDEYLQALENIRKSDPDTITIQVGDIDLGIVKLPELGDRDFFISGNHDSYAACKKHPNFLGSYGFKDGVFYIGGAASSNNIMKNRELGDSDLKKAISLYRDVKPDIVVSHDCPQTICDKMMVKKGVNKTRLCLDRMWNIHQPNIWAFGHYHMSKQEIIGGCKFIALGPLECHQIQLAWDTGSTKSYNYGKPMNMTGKKIVKMIFAKINPLNWI